MTDLYVVRERIVPVEELQPGDRIILTNGRQATVEHVDAYPHPEFGEVHIVRWWRPAASDEPRGDDGRFLGSLIPVPQGHLWSIAL